MNNCGNCKNCMFFRKKIDELNNMNYEGTDKGICLRHVVAPIEETFKCDSWMKERNDLKCKKCGKEIKFAIYIPAKSSIANYEVYTGTDYCIDCHLKMQEEINNIFNLDNLWSYKPSQTSLF